MQGMSAKPKSMQRPRALPALVAVIEALLLTTASVGPALAQGRVFGIFGKSNDVNFVEVARACDAEAKIAGDRCTLIATNGTSHPRLQSELIARTIRDGKYDAFAVSVTETRLVSHALQGVNVPVITFDSPLAGPMAPLAPSYLGIDNIAFGRDLAKLTIRLRPQGGSLCIITSMNHVNLLQRLVGARQVFSGNPHFPANGRLKGEGGWTEAAHCPVDARDDEARSLLGVTVAVRQNKADVVLSLGHWPIGNAASYRSAVAPYRERLVARNTIVVIALGQPSAGQSSLMSDGLVHGFVTIDFAALGKLCYHHLSALVEKRLPPPIRSLPYISIPN